MAAILRRVAATWSMSPLSRPLRSARAVTPKYFLRASAAKRAWSSESPLPSSSAASESVAWSVGSFEGRHVHS